jgi:DNA polymerase III subunit epsilon
VSPARGRGLLVTLVVAYVLVAGAGLVLIAWSGLSPPQRELVAAVGRDQAAALLLLTGGAVAGLVWLLVHVIGRYAATARRLTAATRLLLGPNPDHHLDPGGPVEMVELAGAVNALAQRRRVAETEVARQVSAARAELEAERNRLAALMAELTVAVLVCNIEGRILLYNVAARRLVGDDPAVGLGRSVHGIVDRGLVTHALDRIREGATAHVATVLRDRQLLQVRLAPVHGTDRGLIGFVLVLEDETGRVASSVRADALLRDLSEGTRASLGSIRAAAENVLDSPDMRPQDRRAFIEVVRDEAERLGDRVERWVAESVPHRGERWLLTDVRGADLLAVLARELEHEGFAATTTDPDGPELWLQVDGHAVARVVVHLATCLRDECGPATLALSVGVATESLAQLDVRWSGPAPGPDTFNAWLDQPLTSSGAASAREVVERHGGEVWCGAGARGSAYVRMLLPLTDAASPPQARPGPGVGSRPEFYDFELFDRRAESPEWQERALADLTWTVFDTETTGLDPVHDEIISIGAVRVLGGRLLRQESFDRLVDPGRAVPAGSTAVHGITTSMVRGQPPIDDVLPLFARFAADSVLVGHNVGFDMRLLREKEDRTGIRFDQPVLDTLLLDAAVHPDFEEHSLEAIAGRLGVEVVGRHTALGDATVTAEVFLRLMTLLEQRGIGTLGEALAASRTTLHARRDSSAYGPR